MEQNEFNVSSPGAKLVIVEHSRILCCALDNCQSWLLGRDDPTKGDHDPDIPLASRLVSREHGWFRKLEHDWAFIENPKNLNGIFHNGKKRRKHPRGLKYPIMLSNGDTLRIDNSTLNHRDGVIILFTTDTLSENWDVFSLADRPATIIGRDKSCDISQPYASLSGRHAKITPLNGEYYLSDCGSETGTFQNGNLISGTVILREKDHIRLGSRNYFFVRGNLIYCE